MSYDEFTKNYNYILEYVRQLQEKLDLSTEIIDTLKIKRNVVKLDNIFIELFGNTGTKVIQLLNNIDENGHNDVNEKLEFLKNSIKDIKIKYIKKYNAIVTNINKKIAEMQKLAGVNSEILVRIQKLKELPVYVLQKSFAFNDKLKNVKSAKAIDMINEIESINRLINVKNDGSTLNSHIDKLENKIDGLIHDVENKEIIIDKESRKKINLTIDELEKELEVCEKYLKLYEGENHNDHNIVKSKIGKIREKLIDVSIMYRSKCPLLVKKVKTAKEVYKKNNKLPLIALGVSSLSLVDFVVGPVIIPSIMCGNLMLVRKNPKFSKIITGVNKVLARVIDAKEYRDGYKLHTGIELNEEVASVSLLKTIAIQEGREWVVPLVYDVKNLFEKVKLVRLRETISKGISKTSNKVKTSARNVKESVANNARIKDTLIEISELFREFQRSRLSMDDFCSRNNISNDDRTMLETFSKRVMG